MAAELSWFCQQVRYLRWPATWKSTWPGRWESELLSGDRHSATGRSGRLQTAWAWAKGGPRSQKSCVASGKPLHPSGAIPTQMELRDRVAVKINSAREVSDTMHKESGKSPRVQIMVW